MEIWCTWIASKASSGLYYVSVNSTEQVFTASTLAAELARRRVDSHLSQRVLAKLSGVSNTLISTLESGDAAPPHPTVLRKLATGLATSGMGAMNEPASDEHYIALMRAAGYVPSQPRDAGADEALRRQIEAVIGPDNTPLVERLLDRMRGRPPLDQEAVLRVVDVLLSTLPSRPE